MALVHEGRAEPLQEGTLSLQLLQFFLAQYHVVHRPLNDTEEKAVTRLALTYGVLRRLGFSEDRVMDCLAAISGYDLDEAYDWVSFLLPKPFILKAHQSPEVMPTLFG